MVSGFPCLSCNRTVETCDRLRTDRVHCLSPRQAAATHPQRAVHAAAVRPSSFPSPRGSRRRRPLAGSRCTNQDTWNRAHMPLTYSCRRAAPSGSVPSTPVHAQTPGSPAGGTCARARRIPKSGLPCARRASYSDRTNRQVFRRPALSCGRRPERKGGIENG